MSGFRCADLRAIWDLVVLSHLGTPDINRYVGVMVLLCFWMGSLFFIKCSSVKAFLWHFLDRAGQGRCYPFLTASIFHSVVLSFSRIIASLDARNQGGRFMLPATNDTTKCTNSQTCNSLAARRTTIQRGINDHNYRFSLNTSFTN